MYMQVDQIDINSSTYNEREVFQFLII